MPTHPAYATGLRIPYLRFHEPDGIRTMLYRFFDDQGTLLYVGITDDPRARWSDHAHRAQRNEDSWWHQVRVVHTEWLATRAEAEGAEITAIHGEHPVHNSAHNVRMGAGRRWRAMYLHPIARELYGDAPFTLNELIDRSLIAEGTVRLYAARLVEKGAFRKAGQERQGPHNRLRTLYVALDVPADVASPVKGPLLDAR